MRNQCWKPATPTCMCSAGIRIYRLTPFRACLVSPKTNSPSPARRAKNQIPISSFEREQLEAIHSVLCEWLNTLFDDGTLEPLLLTLRG